MYEPLHNGVIVKLLEEESKTESGIILSDASPMFAVGLVEAVGPGAVDASGKRIPILVSPGDKVIFALYSAAKVEIAGMETFLLVSDDNVVVKIK